MEVSPMLRHAVESFEHGLEHYLDGTDRSRKFALLHIDHAIELFLKEKCIQLGKSIYKSAGQTLTLHEAFNSLCKEIDIPERPRLEELHDLRNTVQHKGLIPDLRTSEFYVEVAYRFAKRFLAEELGVPIEKVISSIHRAMMEAPKLQEAPDELFEGLQEAKNAPDPISKIVAAYTVLEKAAGLLAVNGIDDVKVRLRSTIRDAAVAFGTPEEKINKALKKMFMLRGRSLNSDYDPSEKEADGFIRLVARILGFVGYRLQE
jgi:hypothetical protein